MLPSFRPPHGAHTVRIMLTAYKQKRHPLSASPHRRCLLLKSDWVPFPDGTFKNSHGFPSQMVPMEITKKRWVIYGGPPRAPSTPPSPRGLRSAPRASSPLRRQLYKYDSTTNKCIQSSATCKNKTISLPASPLPCSEARRPPNYILCLSAYPTTTSSLSTYTKYVFCIPLPKAPPPKASSLIRYSVIDIALSITQIRI